MSNAPAVYVSSGAFDTRDIDEIIRLCLEAGVQGLELSSGLPCNDEGFSKLEAAREKHGLAFLLHNYFPAPSEPFVLNLAAQDGADLECSKAHCRNSIDLCGRLGAPFFSVHSGFAVNAGPDQLGDPTAWRMRAAQETIDSDRAYTTFRDTVADLADYAAERSVRLLLENNIIWPELVRDGAREAMLMVEGTEINGFFRDLSHENLGLLVDVAHAKVSATALGFSLSAFMDAVAGHVEAFHLSDNNGLADSNDIFGPDAWFVPFLGRFPRATHVIEAYRLSTADIVRQLNVLNSILALRHEKPSCSA